MTGLVRDKTGNIRRKALSLRGDLDVLIGSASLVG